MPEDPSVTRKAGTLLRDLATPLSVAVVGVLTSVYVNNQQTSDANQRAFAELTSQRETSDTNLRIEMFKTVLGGFLQQGPDSIPEQMLKLEILAYNFNESLDLSPLFQDVFRRVNSNNPDNPNLERLKKVAADVVFKQVESLTFDIGVSENALVDFDDFKTNPAGIPNAITKVMRLRYPEPQAAEHLERQFKLDVFARDPERQELTIHLVVSPPGKLGMDTEPEIDIRFSLGYFDFPSIDNTRLSNGERCAVVVRNMDQRSARISLVYFPANRAGLKDRMYVEEVLQQMVHVRSK